MQKHFLGLTFSVVLSAGFTASPLAAAWPAYFLPHLLASELTGEDKAVFARLMSYKSFKAEDALMSSAYGKLIVLMSKDDQATLKEEQKEWNLEKERETLRILHRRGEDAALDYLTEATAGRRQSLENDMKAYGKTTKHLPDSNVKMPSDVDFQRADAIMAARYAAGLAPLSGRARKEYVEAQRDWNLAKEREYLRIREKSGNAAARLYLVEATRQRADELR